MPTAPDDRTAHRCGLDEAIATEEQLPHPDLPADAVPRPMESHLRVRKPIAIAGVVENGVVRLLDPSVRLTDQSRVIVVANE